MTTKTLCLLIVLFYASILGASSGEERFYENLPFKGTPSPDEWLGRAAGSKRMAIYKDNGVWALGYEHLKLFFKEYGYSYFIVDSRDIKKGVLCDNPPDVLVMPGGASWKYLDSLGEQGGALIREYVQSGGSYLGICAGAFYATLRREGGHATGLYGIGLLEGTAYDGTALEVPPFKEGMLVFPMHWVGYTPLTMVLLGGPSFVYSPEEQMKKKVEVVSTFPDIHQPSMVMFEYGEGKVFLSGPHLEVEEPLTDWDYKDPESDWPLLDDVVQRLSLE